MTEPAEEYKARFAEYVGGKDVIAMQREAPQTLARLIAGVAESELKRRPGPGKWSVTGVAHLAEDELTNGWRYRQMLEYENQDCRIRSDLWAKLGEYAAWNLEEALAMFSATQSEFALVRSIDGTAVERGGHADRGDDSVDLCRHMAAHDINHIEQVGNSGTVDAGWRQAGGGD
jgi:hypothetical protein